MVEATNVDVPGIRVNERRRPQDRILLGPDVSRSDNRRGSTVVTDLIHAIARGRDQIAERVTVSGYSIGKRHGRHGRAAEDDAPQELTVPARTHIERVYDGIACVRVVHPTGELHGDRRRGFDVAVGMDVILADRRPGLCRSLPEIVVATPMIDESV